MIEFRVSLSLGEKSTLEEWALEKSLTLSEFTRALLVADLKKFRADRLDIYAAKERHRARVGG